MSSVDDEINAMLRELDADKVNSILDPEELLKLRKELNPYGRTIQGSDHVLTCSYTDLRKEYLLKLLTTTFIGYLNRACDEWNVPDGMVPVPVYEYLQDPSKLITIEAKIPEKDRVENRKWLEKRIIVKEFLEDLFQFNPDKHVRSAYRPNPEDPQRQEVLDTPAAQLAIEHGKKTDMEFSERMKQHEARTAGGMRIKEKSKTAWQQAQKACGLNKTPEELKSEPLPKDQMLEENVTTMIPPHDIFYRLNNYYESNYEELRKAVEILYCEKPDLETAINPYDWHSSREEADDFINKHKNEVISPIFAVPSGKWGLLGPFKNVRDSVRYYNDNTIVLEEIMKQRESDGKLARDLVKKRIAVKKRENIKEAGEFDPAFISWSKQNSSIKALGGIVDDKDEIPDDCIEVPVIRVSQLKQTVEKDRFFTASEAPNFITESLKSRPVEEKKV
jgi:hypothetical protein